MIRNLSIFCILFTGALLAATAAHADSKLVNGKRFMSLQSARSGLPNLPPKKAAMRSDMKSMRAGFMRLDRDLVINAARTPRVVKATDPEVVALLKADDKPVVTRVSPVTDLFGDNGGSEDPVFGETLRSNDPAVSAAGHIWPIATRYKQQLSSNYGMRKDPFHGKQRFHGGIDIAAAAGTPVMASAAGTVTESGNGGKFGNFVSIKHADGTESMYGHLSAQLVHKGQHVKQGQTVGAVGSTGRSTGPHLDYRIKKNGQRMNPMTVLNAPGKSTTKVAQVIQVR